MGNAIAIFPDMCVVCKSCQKSVSTQGRNAQNVNEFIIIPTREPEGGLSCSWALPISRTTKTSAFSTNAQSRFASVVLDAVLVAGTSVPTVAHLMESLYLFSCETNA